MARILLDECMPWDFAEHLVGHEVSTVGRQRWAGLPDRRIIERAQGNFDIVVTVDRRFVRDVRVALRDVAVVLLRPRRSSIEGLLSFVPRTLAAIDAIRPGEVVTLEEET